MKRKLTVIAAWIASSLSTLANWPVIIACACMLPIAGAFLAYCFLPHQPRHVHGITLPAVATLPPVPPTEPQIALANVTPIKSPKFVVSEPPKLLLQPSGENMLLIVIGKGVVQRCENGGEWDYFAAVNRVPWYFQITNNLEDGVFFRLIPFE